MYTVDLLQNVPIDFNGELKKFNKSKMLRITAKSATVDFKHAVFITLAKNLQQNLHVLEWIYLWICCGFATFLTRVEAA